MLKKGDLESSSTAGNAERKSLKTDPLNEGDLVISKSGRDKGRTFAVVGVTDEAYVYIADGSLRKLENPKKKKIKHLEFSGHASERTALDTKDMTDLTNASLRKLLKNKE